MKLTFSNDQNTVTFSSEESNEIFQVNSHNRLLVQRSELTKARGQYTVNVEGQGCTFIQVIEVYLRERWMFASKIDRQSVQLQIDCYFTMLPVSVLVSILYLIDIF